MAEREGKVTAVLGEARILSQESDAGVGEQLAREAEELGKRWRALVAGIATRVAAEEQGETANINIIVAWTEVTLVAVARTVNVSSLTELKDSVAELQAAQVALLQQQVSLEELSAQVGVSSPLFLTTRQKVERIAALLPRRRHTLEERLERLCKLVEELVEGKSWVKEAETRRTEAQSREEQLKLRLRVSDKEYAMNHMFNEFLLLEREVTSSGLAVHPALAEEVAGLKHAWLQLTGAVRRISTSTDNGSRNGNQDSPGRRILCSPDRNQNTSIVQELPLASSPSSTGPVSSQEQGCHTSASASPLSEEVACPMLPQAVLSSLGAKSTRVVAWLAGLAAEGQRGDGLKVEDPEAVAKELDRQRSLLGQLEARRSQLKEITATATDLHPGAEDVVNQINLLRGEWKSVQSQLLGRKAELTAMLEHSDNLESKSQEVSEWLGRLERQLAGKGVGSTRDVLLLQIREVNDIHRELQRYSHHVSLLTQLCHRLVSIYSRDCTAGITNLAEELGGRYTGLTSSCLARGKSLKAALEALNSFDRELAEFLAWLGEEEGAVERLEHSGPQTWALAERQGEVRTRDSQFCRLTARGRELVAAAGDSDTLLATKVTELGRRWSQLQNCLMGLADRLEKSGEGKSGRVDDQGRWVAERLHQLKGLSLAGSVEGLRAQREEHRLLR